MPTICEVVNCHNRHNKGCKISFYRFPLDQDRRRRWLAFVSRQKEDGSPWQPGDGDRICSEHFILKQKSDIPTNPDYVPSIQSPCSSKRSSQVREKDHFSHFERSQRRSRMVADQRESQELQIVNDSIAYTIAQKAFQHDHGSYCKRSSNYGALHEVSEVRMSPKQGCSYDEAMEEPTISAEVGK